MGGTLTKKGESGWSAADEEMVSGRNIYKKGTEGKASLLSISLHTTVSELKIVTLTLFYIL